MNAEQIRNFRQVLCKMGIQDAWSCSDRQIIEVRDAMQSSVNATAARMEDIAKRYAKGTQ